MLDFTLLLVCSLPAADSFAAAGTITSFDGNRLVSFNATLEIDESLFNAVFSAVFVWLLLLVTDLLLRSFVHESSIVDPPIDFNLRPPFVELRDDTSSLEAPIV